MADSKDPVNPNFNGTLHPHTFITDKRVLYTLNTPTTSIPMVSGINGSHTREIKTRYEKATGEVILDGHANCFIVLGRDRNAGTMSGKGGQGHTGAASIDIIAGHLGPRPYESFFGIKQNSGKDFKNDAARIYLSQKCNIDAYFEIPKIQVELAGIKFDLENSFDKSGIGIKADNVRVIGRETIKIVTSHGGQNTLNGEAILGGVDIIAGYNLLGLNQSLDLQPMVKGKNLMMLLKQIVELIQSTNASLSDFMKRQKEINDILARHTHQSGNAGMPTSDMIGQESSQSVIVKNFELLTTTLPGIIANFIEQASINSDYFNAGHPLYINSSFNRVN